MTKQEFDARLDLVRFRSSKAMRQALADVMVHGKTWREAAIKRSVTESGIFRAMRRMNGT